MTTVSANPSTVTQGSESAQAWTSPSNAAGAPNGSDATNLFFPIAKSLSFTGFGFSLPSTATITGILIETTGSSDADAADNSMNIFNNTTLKYSTVLTDTDAFDSSADGLGLTYDDINNLKVKFTYSTQGDTSSIHLDAIEVTVYYSILDIASRGFRARDYRGNFGRTR